MFRGTDKYSSDQYNDVLKSLGADSNAYTNNDWTCYHMTIPATATATAVQIESDRFPKPQVRRAVVSEAEARAVLGEYNKSCVVSVPEAERSAAEHGLYEPYIQAYYDGFSRRHREHAQPVRLLEGLLRPLVPAGETARSSWRATLLRDELVALVTQYYGGWKRGSSNVVIPDEPSQTEPKSAASHGPCRHCPRCCWAITSRRPIPRMPTQPCSISWLSWSLARRARCMKS